MGLSFTSSESSSTWQARPSMTINRIRSKRPTRRVPRPLCLALAEEPLSFRGHGAAPTTESKACQGHQSLNGLQRPVSPGPLQVALPRGQRVPAQKAGTPAQEAPLRICCCWSDTRDGKAMAIARCLRCTRTMATVTFRERPHANPRSGKET